MKNCLLAPVLMVACSIVASPTWGQLLPVMGPDQLPPDRRLQELKDLDGHFPFQVPENKQAWLKRAEQVRRRMQVSLGLWPEPERTPLNAVVHGKRDMGDYTIEKVYFESVPGYHVSGNLYRPQGKTGRLPAVLSPHGHWANGRFYDAGAEAAKKQIESGAEWSLEGARSPLQARCVHLARLGCVVFHYDMVGYADSQQISYELAHRFATQRAEANDPEKWGFFSPQAESHLQSIMGLQTWNSMRAVDFVLGLEDVDPERLAVTGASGGGTQSFVLAALDPRIAVAMPAVMVSTAMQGGCTCENACCFRVGTGNVEMAALFAPKPLGLTTADDWTKNMARDGFPELQQVYAMMGASPQVMLHDRTEFGHNYNHPSRVAMYNWFNKHLELGFSEVPPEREFRRLTAAELTVYDDEHPRPAAEGAERAVLHWWTAQAARALQQVHPRDADQFRKYREIVGPALDTLIGRGLPDPLDLEFEQVDKVEKNKVVQIAGLVHHRKQGEALPTVFLYPKPWDGKVAIWVHQQGRAGLFGEDGSVTPAVRRLLDAGVSVVGVDLLYQGEFLGKPSRAPRTQTRRVKNPRESAAYTFGYNDSLFARRTHDLLTLTAFVRQHEYTPEAVWMISQDETAPLVAATRAQARGAIDRAAIATHGFRFHQVRDLQDVRFLPGGAKYDDLEGMLAVAAPAPLWLNDGTPQPPRRVQAAYQASGRREALVYQHSDPQDWDAMIRWLLSEPNTP